MGSAKSLMKGIAAGAMLAAAAAMVMEMRDGKGKKKARELQLAASSIGMSVMERAMHVGAVSKSAYERIVDTAMAEYRGIKALSKEDLRDLKKELKAGWKDVKAIAASEQPATRSTKKKKRA